MQYLSPARIPPFRDEQRWGNALAGFFDGLDNVKVSGQLISVNEQPARAWDMLLVCEGVSNLHIDSFLYAEFNITVGVGSTTAKFTRVITLDRTAAGGNDITGDIEALVMPAASFIVDARLVLAPAGAQPFPLKARCGVFAAPRGMPFLASLESTDLLEVE
jgi:hypothetical protein